LIRRHKIAGSNPGRTQAISCWKKTISELQFHSRINSPNHLHQHPKTSQFWLKLTIKNDVNQRLTASVGKTGLPPRGFAVLGDPKGGGLRHNQQGPPGFAYSAIWEMKSRDLHSRNDLPVGFAWSPIINSVAGV
jgi:hypothetical protein